MRGQKIVAIERLKEATAIALRKGDNSFDLGKARFMTAWLAYREIQILIPQAMKKHDLPMPPMEVAGAVAGRKRTLNAIKLAQWERAI